MHESIFSYNLTRPYPFKWFTPAVILGGLAFTALFSFINVAATGYEMVAVSTFNPNATSANKTFFSNWPSYLSGNTKPSCESKMLGVSNVYYTSNTALSYKLESIYQNTSCGIQHFGDLPYHNNVLENCSVSSTEIFFQGLDRTAFQIAMQQWGAELKASITCTIAIPEGSRTIKLTTSYDLNSDAARFPGRNATSKASLWWGESLLAWYYLKLTRDVYMDTQAAALSNASIKTYKGYVKFSPRQEPITSAKEFARREFYPPADCFFVPFSEDGIERQVEYCDPKKGWQAFQDAEFWSTAATITKVLQSTILIDLGQSTPNILVEPEMLQFFSSNISQIASLQNDGQKWGWGNNMRMHDHPDRQDLASAPYTTANGSKWHLGSERSFIANTYLCQVPRLKSRGALVVSVLVANLVFLQALWKGFVLGVDFFMDRGAGKGVEAVRLGRGTKAQEDGGVYARI